MLTTVGAVFGTLYTSLSTLTAPVWQQSSAATQINGWPELNDFQPQPALMDNSTYANVDSIRQRHLHLDFDIDFDRQGYSGSITLDMNATETTHFVSLDTWYLDIKSVHWQPAHTAKKLIEGGVAMTT